MGNHRTIQSGRSLGAPVRRRARAVRPLLRLTGLLVGALLLSGCYFTSVESNQIGIETMRGEVNDIKGPGGHQSLDPFAQLHLMDVSAKTVEWADPDLVTADKQPIGVSIAATFARRRDAENVRLLWDQYRSEAVSDEALLQQVSNRIPSVAKTVTARYTLDELLGTGPSEGGGRSVVQNDLFILLQPELEEFGVDLLDIRVSNFAPDQAYLDLLKEKAQVGLEREIAQQRTLQLEEQLKQEQAQTEIDLERARRQNEVDTALSRVYDASDRYYELERLRLLQDVIGESDKLYFIPEGADLTLILSGQNNQQILPGVPESP